MSDELGPAERALLSVLDAGERKASELKVAGGAKARDAAVAALVGRGFATQAREGRSYRCAITDAGREANARLPPAPEKRTRAPRAQKGPGADELRTMIAALLDEKLAPIAARLDRLLAAREGERAIAPTEAPAEALLLDAVARLDAERQYGGLVPIPALRRELARDGHRDRAAIDAALLALEDDGALRLLVAQSPATLADRADGIDRPGRGLIYYVARGGA